MCKRFTGYGIAASFALSLIACGSGSSNTGNTGNTGNGTATAGNASSDLIPRKVLFGNPERTSAKISPDGTKLSFLAPVDGVLNVWVGPVDDMSKAKPITGDKKRPVRRYGWAATSAHIIFSQDSGGDEDWHIYSVDLASGKKIDLTPFKKVAAQIWAGSAKHPDWIVVGVNNRVKQLHDAHKVNIRTGERTILLQNPGFVGFNFDNELQIRTAVKPTPTGGMDVLAAIKGAKGVYKFEPLFKIPQADAMSTSPLSFDKTNENLYLWDSRGRNTKALVALNMKTKQTRVLAENAKADGSNIMMHPTNHTVQAVGFTRARREWKILDESIKPDFDKLGKVARGEFHIVSKTLNDRKWVVAFSGDTAPTRYYLWDRDAQKEKFLFVARKALEGLKLAPMHPVVIKSRDNKELVSYLTLPIESDKDNDGKPEAAQPMVLLVHGGPWARDNWGYNPLHQLFANRGYAVLSVNFRGSTGLGKDFVNAGDREWARKMHDDLIDAVNWAVKGGIADKKRVCIAGGSYGGYATLVGMTMTPDVFACGVDIVGPSSIVTLLKAIPPYWKPMIAMFKARVGDWTTPEGIKDLESRSPLHHVGKITRPLLIGQGANDPRVKQAEADQIVKAMQAKKIPVSYVLFPDEGHGFARTENSLAFFAAGEAFLSKHLGGKYQPATKAGLKASTIQVKAGIEGIPGFAEAMK